jgi:hypothetical protein
MGLAALVGSMPMREIKEHEMPEGQKRPAATSDQTQIEEHGIVTDVIVPLAQSAIGGAVGGAVGAVVTDKVGNKPVDPPPPPPGDGE